MLFIRSLFEAFMERTRSKLEAFAATLPHETIQIDGKPYLTRYYLGGQAYAGGKFERGRANTRELGEGRHLFLHHFHTSDQGRELHNHPYTGLSLMLLGGYREERMTPVDYEVALAPAAPGSSYAGVVMAPVYGGVTSKLVRPGQLNALELDDFHRTELLDTARGAWTLFLTGPRVKDWGFIDRRTGAFTPHDGEAYETADGAVCTRDERARLAEAFRWMRKDGLNSGESN